MFAEKEQKRFAEPRTLQTFSVLLDTEMFEQKSRNLRRTNVKI